MTSGKCPHPWNVKKKGTFKAGHKQINKGRGCFKKGCKLKKELRDTNQRLGQERYKAGTHPFCKVNQSKIARVSDQYYGLTKAGWIKTRREIKERDEWKCQKCKCDLHNRKSNCHHLLPWEIFRSNDERILATLCIPCHARIEYHTRLLFGCQKLDNFGKD